MKKEIITAVMLGATLSMSAANKIDRIEPTNWFVGMKNPQVQLMVYGKNILRPRYRPTILACALIVWCVLTRPTICWFI